ncbi:hypothetical protein EON65_29135 [archaeon]|nr:MAG: hypothetical protein EON65_29135 [archaeon]
MKNLINPSSVFGAAPSLERMKSINKVKKLYRGATFWYYFRVYLPYFYPVLFLLFLILSLTVYKDNIQGNLVLGSVLSLFMGSAVIVSYIMIVPWRKHPSSLILNRALANIVFSLVIIFEAISTSQRSCSSYAAVTQLTILSGEGWLTTIALDLIYSITNPFISYKVNLRKYQLIVGVFTGFITLVFWNDTSCQGQFDQGICWIRIDSTNSPCLWGYFLFWMVCMYSYQIYASVYAYLRLKKGLSTSFEVRKQCAQETFTCLLVYAVYMSFLVFCFCIIASDPAPAAGSGMARFSLFFMFLVANRGSIDGIVWFMLHDFHRDSSSSSSITGDSTKLSSVEEGRKEIEMTASESELEDTTEEGDPDTHDEGAHLLAGAQHQAKKVVHDVEKKLTKTFTELADLAIADLDEADLSPQVNLALRQQVVQYVTMGVRNAVKGVGIDNKPGEEIKDIMDNVFRKPDIAVIPGLPVLEFYLDNEYLFKSFAPDVFRTLRQNEGISDDTYLKILSASANERLSEGASGAFMFFCGGNEFIVKTIRDREARVLHQSLHTYTTYLQKHPESLLCRFLGSYSLEIFSQVFYFVVMLNCFDPKAEINERFDIKGSWVGRSAEPPKKGRRVVCRHCNEYFVPGRKKEDNVCRVVVGPHEANVVLKDNDLRVKISLPPEDAQKVLNILKRDSDLLGKLGVLDYR